ncbi:phosphocholine cytidylyltransferase family protein [Gammaproteobacteria bacterium]|nr:phosphocholine cytidylyltransferase family protein [Gammaproteobacteria bacterium]
MKVIILAAGSGNRLKPYTNDKPKCMVELLGKPILQYQVETLNALGLDDILVVGGYHIEKIKGYQFKIIKNEQYDCTNMVSSLFCAEDFINQNEDLIISYSDIIFEKEVLENLLKSNAPIAISVDKNWSNLWQTRMENPLDDAETLKIKDEIYVRELGKKPKNIQEIEGQYMGLIKVRSDFIIEFCNTWHSLDKKDTYDGQDFKNMYMTSFLQVFINRGIKVEAAFTNGGWLEIDTKDDLELYHSLHENNKLDMLIKL